MKNKIIIALMLMCTSCIDIYGETYQLSNLVDKTWRGVTGYMGCESIDITLEFSEDSLVFKAWPKNDNGNIITLVYNIGMCSTVPESRTLDDVPKQDYGNYILMERKYDYKGKTEHEWIVLEILSLTDSSLTLKSGKAVLCFEV